MLGREYVRRVSASLGVEEDARGSWVGRGSLGEEGCVYETKGSLGRLKSAQRETARQEETAAQSSRQDRQARGTSELE